MKQSIIPSITSEVAQNIDKELMSTFCYSIDQLMEIAGLSVAKIIKREFVKDNKDLKILTICGPGNNGGDGLVASRYLKEFQCKNVDIFYPKTTNKELYQRLIKQCESYKIPFKDQSVIDHLNEYDIIVDSIFGFSFKGDIREPFKLIVEKLGKYNDKIISVDIPSGWDVEKGNIHNTFSPSTLISLTLPKKCSENFSGKHFLAGRFVPQSLYQKFGIEILQDLYSEDNLYVLL